jgi:hypothetical protein
MPYVHVVQAQWGHTHLEPWVLLGLSEAPKEDSDVSLIELLTGSPPILPGQLQHVPDLHTHAAVILSSDSRLPASSPGQSRACVPCVLVASKSHWWPHMAAYSGQRGEQWGRLSPSFTVWTV